MAEPRAELDTVRLAWRPLGSGVSAGPGVNASVRNVGEDDEGWSYTTKLAGGGATLLWGGEVAALELSAPKVAQGHNVTALPVREAMEVCREVYGQAGEYVDVSVPFEEVGVNRLDLVRDFEAVHRAELTLRALSTTKVKGRATTRLYRDAASGGAPTLWCGNNSRSARLYDKAAEVAARGGDETVRQLADGRLRFEAQCRRRPLRNLGWIATVSDVTEFRAGRLRREMWEWLGWGREVSGVSKLVTAVMTADDLSARERLSCLGYYLARSQGVPMGELVSRNTASKYESKARELGLILTEGCEDLGEVTLVLDYERGREQLRLAS